MPSLAALYETCAVLLFRAWSHPWRKAEPKEEVLSYNSVCLPTLSTGASQEAFQRSAWGLRLSPLTPPE